MFGDPIDSPASIGKTMFGDPIDSPASTPLPPIKPKALGTIQKDMDITSHGGIGPIEADKAGRDSEAYFKGLESQAHQGFGDSLKNAFSAANPIGIIKGEIEHYKNGGLRGGGPGSADLSDLSLAYQPANQLAHGNIAGAAGTVAGTGAGLATTAAAGKLIPAAARGVVKYGPTVVRETLPVLAGAGGYSLGHHIMGGEGGMAGGAAGYALGNLAKKGMTGLLSSAETPQRPYVAPPPIKPMMNGSTVTDRIASAQGPKASIPPIRPMQNGPGAPQPISKPLAPIPPIRPMNRLVPEPELGPKAPIPPLRPMSKAEPVATGPKAPIPPLRYPNKPVASAKPQPTVTSPKTEVSPETQSLFDRSTPEYQPKPSSGSSLSPHAQQVYDSLDKMGDDAPHSIRELQSKNPDIPRPELEKALLELRNKRMAYGSVSDQKLPPEHAVTNPDNPTQQFVGFSKRFDTEPPTIASAKPQATVVQPSKGQAIPGEDNRPLRAVRDYRGGQDEQGYGETTEENTNRSSNAQRAWNILKKEGWTAKDLRDESNQSDLMDLLKANAKNISVRKIKPEAYVPSPETLEAIRTLAEAEEKR